MKKLNKPLLSIKNLSKTFGGIEALKECNLDIPEKSITAIIGPNGAGKTTLFNIITGFTSHDKGEILLNNKKIHGLQPHQIFSKGIVRTFQTPRELKNMTVIESLMLVPKNQVGENPLRILFSQKKIARQEMQLKKEAIKILEFLDLNHLQTNLCSNLSTGQKKLLELGRTLMAKPQLVLLDEPAAGVNRTLLKSISKNIDKACKEKGITFILIEHDMNFIMNLCNPIIVLNEGKKIAEGNAKEIINDPTVLEAYLGRKTN